MGQDTAHISNIATSITDCDPGSHSEANKSFLRLLTIIEGIFKNTLKIITHEDKGTDSSNSADKGRCPDGSGMEALDHS
jgi:hypothetical protein